MPAYLADLRRAAIDGRGDERTLIDALERILRVVTSANGKKVFARLEIDRRALFDGLESDALPKVRAFLEKRLPRAITS